MHYSYNIYKFFAYMSVTLMYKWTRVHNQQLSKDIMLFNLSFNIADT